MPHQRIADWARNLIGDLQTIDGNGPAAAAATVGVKDEDDQENPLTLKRLKGNIYRFARVTKPVAATLDSFKALRQWESPTASFLLLSVLNNYLPYFRNMLFSQFHFAISLSMFIVVSDGI